MYSERGEIGREKGKRIYSVTMTDEMPTAVHGREEGRELRYKSIYRGKETRVEMLDRDMIHPFQSLFL
jgi:hypothetical protein